MKRGLIIFILLSCAVFAEDHYVTPSGTGDGSSVVNAWDANDFNNPNNWDSVANSNNGKIGPGDTVYFSGTFNVELAPQGSGTAENHIVFDGYKDGNLNMLDDNCNNCAKIIREQIINRWAFNIDAKHYLEIQDFEMAELNTAIRMAPGSSYLYVKRNIIHDTLDDGLIIHDSNNLVVGGARGDGNHFYDCGTGTGAADVVSTGSDYVVVSYNWLEGGHDDCRGIDGVTLNSRSNNYLIEYNVIENHNDRGCGLPEPYASDPRSSDPNWLHGLQGPGEDATDVKKLCHNVVIRGNVLRGHYYQGGLHVHGRGYSVYLYGNYIADNAQGAIIFNNENDFSDTVPAPHDIHIWSNIFEGNYGPAVSFVQSQAGGSNPREPYDLYVYNNVFFGNVIENDPFDKASVSSVTSAVAWFAGRSSGRGDRNNVFYKNRIDEQPYHHEVFKYNDWKSFDEDSTCVHSHNTYFDPRGTSNIRWYNQDGTYTTKTLDWVKSNTNLAQESFDLDPGMEDPENSKYWAALESSQIVGSGAPLTDEKLPDTMCFLEDESICIDMSYREGLAKETDWTTNPPTVVWKTFDTENWDRGPYVFSEGSLCIPNWDCTNYIWGDCIEGTQTGTRTCSDLNSCGVSTGKPIETDTQNCNLPTDKHYTAYKTSATINIDGDITEFSSANAITLTNSQGTTGSYKLMWDNNFLYIAAEITDNKINAQHKIKDADLWQDDAMELIFDTLHDGGTRPQHDDYKFYINAIGTLTDGKAYDRTWDSGMVVSVNTMGTNQDDGDIDSGYIIETKIPLWTSVNNNTIWGMNLVLNDDHGSGKTNTIWSGSAINTVDDAGEIVFIAKSCSKLSDVIQVLNQWKSNTKNLSEVMDAIKGWKNCN